ncbi:transcription initiation factor TFIID subunit 3 isoform X3 [Hetaerina americana]|uniref:transcription initiation factor TFIID subunit 3 isoform X3 n=1 Tax=Hetaerina americana TaxID=62018 RepID=UPI003A7F4311
MTLVYTKGVLRVVVAQICQTIGWHTIQNSALEILVDILHHYIEDLTKLTHRYSDLYGYTIPNLDHLALAFHDLGINLDELEEYVQFVEPVPCAKDIPKYPLPHESHLNFLKPGSREVVHRPVHVHEHLPPMHPEMEEDEYNGKQNIASADNAGSPNGSSPLHSPKAGVFKRPGEPISSESSASKRLRSTPEEEGRPLREITSVIMTTSGFLSPAREGKLPESRIPIPPSDSRSNSPLPPSYPMVPPEVKGEKKSKKGTLKKSLDGLKRLNKENKKKETKSKEAKKSQKHMLVDDSKVKKLISMKEFSKLKAFKAGALKLMARSTSGGSGSKSKMSSSKMSLSKSHGKALKFNKVASQSKMSKVDKFQTIPLFPQPKIHSVEKVKAPKTVEGKLSSEPDKQKLNIFKKISKVKEEKLEKDKFDRIDPMEFYPKDSRESSPGLVIDEFEVQNQQREARLVQINDCINAVIMRGMKEISHDSKLVRESKSQVMAVSSSVSKNDSSVSNVVMAHGPDSSKDIYMFDDNDLSPPGTPSTPKTPELPTPARKLEKIMEKKKKKDKSKSKKDSKGKLAKDLLSAKKIKVEVNDYENSGRPKTPEVPEPQENVQTPVFPFFPSCPPPPGLIPPPLSHHLLSRFPISYSGLPKPGGGALGQHPLSSNLPHPAMPNLPLPPAVFMQPRPDEQMEVKEEPPDKPIAAPQPCISPPGPVVVKTEKVVEKSQPHPLVPKEKVVEKKSKEHKKEKKDKDKVKKKKDKKEKGKGKEKGEKKRDKEEKKERDKDKEKGKEKKEKKEKKKDKEKEREDKSETSVPKLTLKLPPSSSSSPRPSTPDSQTRKLKVRICKAIKNPQKLCGKKQKRFSVPIRKDSGKK